MFGYLPSGFREDLAARGFSRRPALSSLRRPAVHYTYLMRLAADLSARRNPVARLLGAYFAFRTKRYGTLVGVALPPGVAQPGLFIVHCGGIVVNGRARLGRNCRIHAGVNIGQTPKGVPTIGDDVYLGPGAKVFGPITIGDGARIGANAVVDRDVPAGAVAYMPRATIRTDVSGGESADIA